MANIVRKQMVAVEGATVRERLQAMDDSAVVTAFLGGEDLLQVGEYAERKFRENRRAMVFHGPMHRIQHTVGNVGGTWDKQKISTGHVATLQEKVQSVRRGEQKFTLARRVCSRNLTIDENTEPTPVGRDACGSSDRCANGTGPAVLGRSARGRTRTGAHFRAGEDLEGDPPDARLALPDREAGQPPAHSPGGRSRGSPAPSASGGGVGRNGGRRR